MCAGVLFFGLCGAPWPHLALLLLLLLGSRAQPLAFAAVLLAVGIAAALAARGLRLVVRMDGDGHVGMTVIRHGAPIEALKVRPRAAGQATAWSGFGG